MRRSRARFSGSVASCRMPWLAGFKPESDLSVRTRHSEMRAGHSFGHSFRRTECEQTATNVTNITDFSMVGGCEASFGTRGSQVQILPLRPSISGISSYSGLRARSQIVAGTVIGTETPELNADLAMIQSSQLKPGFAEAMST